MLQSFQIQNFKCLRDVKVDLGPFTVLIGPSDSGKTSILEALRLLGRTLDAPYTEVFTGKTAPTALAWRGTPDASITWVLRLADPQHSFHYSWSLNPVIEFGRCGDGFRFSWDPGKTDSPEFTKGAPSADRWSPGETTLRATLLRPSAPDHPLLTHIRALMSGLRGLSRYRLDPEALRTPAAPAPDAVLSPRGDNLVAVLDRLFSGPERGRIDEIEAVLRDAVPTLRGVALRTIDGKTGAKTLEFVLRGASKPPLTIPCEHASDGAMLLLGYLALAYSDEPGMLLVEEPENGLHPARLGMVIEILRKIAAGEIGVRPRQVIVTTQSPLLLNFTAPEEVRIVRRDHDPGTVVTPMSRVTDVDKLGEELGLGALSYRVGA